MNGSGNPLFGNALVTTPILMAACKPIKSVSPDASNSPKVSRARLAMIQSANDKNDKRHDHQQRRDQSEFLADDRENKIRVMLGNKTELLPAVAQAQAGPTARAQRHHRLVLLETFDPVLYSSRMQTSE